MVGQLDETRLHDLVQETIARWRDGERPDAAALLSRHPALSRHKSLAIDLIYEEYCLRSNAGDTLIRSTFLDKFPGYQQSLVKMLEVHAAFEQCEVLKPKPIVWPKIGDSFQGYELVESLGRGSLARVFLARETALGGRLVVVKISQHGAREAQMLGKVAHPAIVPVFSVTHDEASGWTVICMPLLGTATATDLLDAAFAQKQAPAAAGVILRVAGQFRPVGTPRLELPAAEQRAWQISYVDGIAHLGLRLAEGLQAAHDAGIMHRDIKPSNVLLAWSGQPMLLDFNLSTDINLISERVGGTLPYMAPELMRGLAADSSHAASRKSARQFDARSDVFSLGAVLYQLLTGQLPGEPENAANLPVDAIEPWLACRQQPVAAPRSLNPAVPPELEAIVVRCLANEPERRFVSADALAADLQRYLSPRAKGLRLMRKHRRKLLCLAAGLGAIAVSGGVYSANLAPYEERLLARGLAEYDRGEFTEATRTFAECLAIRPDWADVRFARGQALRQLGQFSQAREEFHELVDGEHAALGLSLKGFCNLEEREDTGAYQSYQAAYELGANDAVTLTNLAHCLRSHQQVDEAILHLDRAIAANLNLAAAYYQRALCHLTKGGPATPTAQTLDDARQACKLSPETAAFHIIAASALVRGRSPTDDQSEIVEHLQHAIDLGYPWKPIAFDSFFEPLAQQLKRKSTPTKSEWRERTYAVPSTAPAIDDFSAANGQF